jgi:HD-GYP domain-containing protein (c-di-GMP phosphodiesterase class II)
MSSASDSDTPGLRSPLEAVATTRAGPARGGYLPLPLRNVRAGEPAPCDLLVRARVPRQPLDQFQTFWAPGEIIRPDQLTKLTRLGITRLYFRKGDQTLILAYLHRHLPFLLDDYRLTWKDKAERLADLIWFWVHRFFTCTQAQGLEQLCQGFTYLDYLLSMVREDYSHRSWVLSLLRRDLSLFSHGLNTSLLGMAFAHFLRWPERQVRDFARGALLHDVGMTKVPPAILTKKGKLTPEEQEEIRKHPTAGFHLLKEAPLLSRGSLLLIIQHHEHGDGSGYPAGLKLAFIHPLARMMRLIDSFDALVSPRHWRPGYPPVRALWIMRQDWQKRGMFDARLLADFIRFLGGEVGGHRPRHE